MDKIIEKSREKAAKKKKKKGPSLYEKMLGMQAEQQGQQGADSNIKKSANLKSTQNIEYSGNSKGGIASSAKRFTGKTESDAVMNAAMELGIPSTDLKYTVIDSGSNGFLGLFKKPVIIEIKEEEKETEVMKSQTIEKEQPKKKAQKSHQRRSMRNQIVSLRRVQR